jgi:phospholipid/cholesterol/gamma-HCH transport system substrate-binding protein
MSESRLQTKVGLFVFVGLVLLALLLIQFSKGTTFFRGTYELRLHAANVGGLKQRSSVLLAGVPVGTVSDIELAEDGKSVTIHLKIYKRYTVYSDARFVIEQSGFLGDQFVSIIAAATPAPDRRKLEGDDVSCDEPFNLQEVARSASGFIQRIDETARKLNDTIIDVRRLVLNEQTLTNLAASVGNMRLVSERALVTVDAIGSLVESNRAPIAGSVSNLTAFSQEANRLAEALAGVLATNSADISAAVKNIESSTVVMKSLFDDLQAGKGLAGNVLKNDTMATNLAVIIKNLAVTSSNLNRLGLLGILWKQKEPRTNQPPATPLAAPHDPFR